MLAIEAKTGKLLWEFDPQIPGEYAAKGCCDVVNRGVAVWGGKVFLGAFDGRLIALDAKTGKKVWETLTVDQSQDYTITGAPRVVKGKVHHRQRRRRVRRARLRLGLRRRHRQDGLALLHRARQSQGRLRDQDGRDDRQDLERRVVEVRRRRHGVGFHGLRSRPRPRSTSASATARPGTTRSAATARATTCSSPPSSPSGPTPASTSGTSRPRPARTGTTPPRST